MIRAIRLLSTSAVCAALLGAASIIPAASVGATTSTPTPVWSKGLPGWDRSSSPTIADVDGDSIPEISFGTQDGWVHVLKHDGSALPGWPQPAIVKGGATSVDSTPAVADLDNDGSVEIIVGVGSTWRYPQHGGVVVFNRDGSVRWRFQTKDSFNTNTMSVTPDGYSDGVYASPSIGDVDGDGKLDVVFGAWDWNIYALNRNGGMISGFPFFNDDTVWSSPALYDVDDDGRMEIFTGGDASTGHIENWAGGVVRALDWQNGVVKELWKQRPNEVVDSSPAIGDINGDGRMELVVGTGDFYQARGGGSDHNKVFAFHLNDGSPVPGWPVTTGGINWGSPAIGDLDKDGVDDVVIGSRNGWLYAWKGDGTLMWAKPGDGGPSGVPTAFHTSPIIADLNGDGYQDVAVGNGWAFHVFRGKDGARLHDPIERFWSFENAPAVGDFGPHGWKLITIGFSTPANSTQISAYNIPKPAKKPSWPMFRKGPLHLAAPPSGGDPIPADMCARSKNPESVASKASGSGYWILSVDGNVYPYAVPDFGSPAKLGIRTPMVNIVPTKTGGGYWVLGADGGVFSFGDATFLGSMGGTALNGPIIGMTATPSGKGYWLLGSDGGVFSFGDAKFFGSMGAAKLNGSVISISPTPSGKGYWLLGADGGVFSFGDAVFFGSMGAAKLNAPVMSIAPSPSGAGYWMLGGDGGVFSFGVPFKGSVPGTGICFPPRSMQIRPTITGHGYWLLSGTGGVYSFGDAYFYGAHGGLGLFNRAVDMGVRP